MQDKPCVKLVFLLSSSSSFTHLSGSFIQQERRKKTLKTIIFFKISKTGRRNSVRRKNSSIGYDFIKRKNRFNLQSYLHATNRAMWVEQTASTQPLHQSKVPHDVLGVLLEVLEPFHQMQPSPSGEHGGRNLRRIISKVKVDFFFFLPPDIVFYLKSHQCTNEVAERHALISGEYLPFLTPQEVHGCLAVVVLPYI